MYRERFAMLGRERFAMLGRDIGGVAMGMIPGLWFGRTRCGLLECEGSEWSQPHRVYLQMCERTNDDKM